MDYQKQLEALKQNFNQSFNFYVLKNNYGFSDEAKGFLDTYNYLISLPEHSVQDIATKHQLLINHLNKNQVVTCNVVRKISEINKLWQPNYENIPNEIVNGIEINMGNRIKAICDSLQTIFCDKEIRKNLTDQELYGVYGYYCQISSLINNGKMTNDYLLKLEKTLNSIYIIRNLIELIDLDKKITTFEKLSKFKQELHDQITNMDQIARILEGEAYLNDLFQKKQELGTKIEEKKKAIATDETKLPFLEVKKSDTEAKKYNLNKKNAIQKAFYGSEINEAEAKLKEITEKKEQLKHSIQDKKDKIELKQKSIEDQEVDFLRNFADGMSLEEYQIRLEQIKPIASELVDNSKKLELENRLSQLEEKLSALPINEKNINENIDRRNRLKEQLEIKPSVSTIQQKSEIQNVGNMTGGSEKRTA